MPPGEMNKLLQKGDNEFWESLTPEQFATVGKYSQCMAGKVYTEEIRSIIPREILEQVRPFVKQQPSVPLTRQDYLKMRKEQQVEE